MARYLQLPLFQVSESLNVSGVRAEETNNESAPDLPAAENMFNDPQILTYHHSWHIIVVIQSALILTLIAFWLYKYTI
ncbi:hypothetical protein B0H12DRAFT_1261602 [Mycena haematopus]|nr:hypothetical protein B0H12DRAFT_1261602 [Mycena haematopus]